MQLIDHNDTIYLEFLSKSKIIKKSLNLTYNKENLKYAQTTLLPIFQKLYVIKIKSPLKQKSLPAAINEIKTLLSSATNELNAIYILPFIQVLEVMRYLP